LLSRGVYEKQIPLLSSYLFKFSVINLAIDFAFSNSFFSLVILYSSKKEIPTKLETTIFGVFLITFVPSEYQLNGYPKQRFL